MEKYNKKALNNLKFMEEHWFNFSQNCVRYSSPYNMPRRRRVGIEV